MTIGDGLFLVLAGFVAGVVSSIVSLASLVSYPALLAVGLPPVVANVTNTVALTFSGVGSALGSQRELKGLRRTVLRLGLTSAVGAVGGGVLLLAAPAESFEAVVPWLILLAALLLLLQPRLLRRRGHHPGGANRLLLMLTIALVSVYVGYFGAGGGILLFTAINLMTTWNIVVSNAVKNTLTAFGNGAASIIFIASGEVRWLAAVPLAAGFLVGGWLGPSVVRRLKPAVFRRVAVGAAVTLAIKLAADHYR